MINANILKSVSLDELIAEINRRGFTVTQNQLKQEEVKKNEKVSETLGGRARSFTWSVTDDTLIIKRIDCGIRDLFSLDDLLVLIKNLDDKFGKKYFPLSNNIAKLPKGEEVDGMGKLMYESDASKNVTRAQASSQLAVIFRECGIFKWNGRKKGIELCLIHIPQEVNELRECLMAAI